jgi:DNA N-6-adenine-methyltransferase (Dam)
MALHEQAVGATDEWYTPPHVFQALDSRFDMDVASPGRAHTPWIPAKHFILPSQGLIEPWRGFVWMNPPFGARNGLMPWLKKFFDHGHGIALVPDRTSAPWWQEFVPLSDLVLFVSPKIKFIGETGESGRSPAQGTCLLGAGRRAQHALQRARAAGLGVLMTPVKEERRKSR